MEWHDVLTISAKMHGSRFCDFQHLHLVLVVAPIDGFDHNLDASDLVHCPKKLGRATAVCDLSFDLIQVKSALVSLTLKDGLQSCFTRCLVNKVYLPHAVGARCELEWVREGAFTLACHLVASCASFVG